MKTYPFALALLVLAGCRSTSKLEVVSEFDSGRYLGTWYEIARYPHRFEKGLSAVSAEYSANDDGTIKVVNKGYLAEKKEWKSIEGVAKPKDDPTRGWLKVSFFKPFYASYKIVHLDPGYTEAIIAGPTYGYLWILARDPVLPPEHLSELVAKTAAMGYDTNKLVFVDQTLNQP